MRNELLLAGAAVLALMLSKASATPPPEAGAASSNNVATEAVTNPATGETHVYTTSSPSAVAAMAAGKQLVYMGWMIPQGPAGPSDFNLSRYSAIGPYAYGAGRTIVDTRTGAIVGYR